MRQRSSSKHIMARFAFFASMLLLATTQPVPAREANFPRLTQYVTDLTGTLTSSDISVLNGKLEEFDRASSTQIVVLMVPTIGDDVIEEVTLRVAEQNGIGQKGKSNGALLFIARNDKRVRIEVGYGLEGALPDILSGQIIRKEMGPKFRVGDYAGGINAAIDAMILATRNEYKADPRGKRSSPILVPIFVILFVLFLFGRAMFRSRFSGGVGRGISRGGWIGGGFGGGGGGFGGGGGGFSGGGGGFGGGGASGSW